MNSNKEWKMCIRDRFKAWHWKQKKWKFSFIIWKNKERDKETTIEDLDHEIEEIYEILNDQIGSRDTTI